MAKAITWGYVRVSSKEQNEDRQMEMLREAGVAEEHIIIDKQSGKNFDRAGYNYLMSRLCDGDVLVILSIDRLGRDYTEIQNQWRIITQEKMADVRVLDMPLLDTTQSGGNLDRRFLADLVLQILSYVAEKERINIRARQRQGIDVMPINADGKRVSKKTGRACGKPPYPIPENWKEMYAKWKAGEITAVECMRQTGVTKTRFYNMVKNTEK